MTNVYKLYILLYTVDIQKEGEDGMIHVEHVSRSWKQFALRDISFTLPKGAVMGLIGKNGAGKTTLLHILLGLYEPEEGQVLVNGYSTGGFRKDSMGFVLNEELFLGGISLWKNAEYFGSFYSRYSGEVFRRLCETYHLDSDRKLKTLSKGEKLKFQFAFALSHDPQVLILDEPTANFDPEFREEVIKTVTGFVSDGEHSVLLATHLTDELDRIADYITFLHEGKLLFSEDKEELYDTYRLVSGEEYKLRLLPKDKIVYMETGNYRSRAFVKNTRRIHYDKELLVEIPSIEDVMYFLLKAEKQGGEALWKKGY